MSKLVLFGGHGKIARLFTQLVSQRCQVLSVIRNKDQASTIESLGAKAVVLSLADASVEDLRSVLAGARYVLWAAGAGGKQGREGTVQIDYLAAKRVFDAIESLESEQPRILVVSAVGARDPSRPPPSHWSSADVEKSSNARYNADKDLASRKGLTQWTILNPTTLTDDEATGRVALGEVGYEPSVTRGDVAEVLAALLDRSETYGKAYELTGGDSPINDAINEVIKKGISTLYI